MMEERLRRRPVADALHIRRDIARPGQRAGHGIGRVFGLAEIIRRLRRPARPGVPDLLDPLAIRPVGDGDVLAVRGVGDAGRPVLAIPRRVSAPGRGLIRRINPNPQRPRAQARGQVRPRPVSILPLAS
jgi:hypothetical protein